MSESDTAVYFFNFGSFVFAGVGLVMALLTVYAGYLTYRAERVQGGLERDLARLGELEKKVNGTLILASDMVLNALPQITFTQQIPASIVDDVGIIDDIFNDVRGHEIWLDVSRQPRAARLAYARAVHRLGLFPTTPSHLSGSTPTDTRSVAALLDVAEKAMAESPYDPIALRRDIAVRRVQCFRQAENFERALEAAADLDKLRDDAPAWVLGPWCRALVNLQKGFRAWDVAERRAAFEEAVSHLHAPFETIFGGSSVIEPADGASRVTAFNSRGWHGVELGSIAYYYAKALAAVRYTCEEQGEPFPPTYQAKLLRALDLSLLFYEDARRKRPADQMTFCIYHFCVPLLVALAADVAPGGLDAKNFETDFPDLRDRAKLREHALIWLDTCENQIDKPIQTKRNNSVTYIYCERSERIDHVSRFKEDVRLVRRVLEKGNGLQDLFKSRAGNYA